MASKRKQVKAKQAAFRAYKGEKGCQDCGEKDPIVLEFHHIRNKLALVSEKVQSWSLQRLWEEIDKCVVLCANCHRRRTIIEQVRERENE